MAALPDFVHKHLDRIATAERFQSYTVEHEAGSKTGDGFMGEIVAVTLRGPRGSADVGNTTVTPNDTLSLICKLLPSSIERQENFKCKEIFEREVHMYDRVLPLLHKFQIDNGLTEETGFFAYAQCYVAVADPLANEYVLILRDLRQLGYTMSDKLKPIAFEKARSLFEQLGRLHGLALAMDQQCGKLFEPIRQLDDKMSVLLPTMRPMLESAYDQAVRYVEKPEHKRIMQNMRDNWQNLLAGCVNGQKTDRFAVLGHGDCWNNNMMFGAKNKICLLDWQIARYVSPALDLAYFLCSSTDKALRDRHYDQLLRIYHESLSGIVAAIAPHEKNPSWLMTLEQLHEELRLYGRYGVLMAPVLLQVIVAPADQIVDMDAMARDMSRPDYDPTKKEVELARFDDKSLAVYRQRLGDVIDDAQRLGWV